MCERGPADAVLAQPPPPGHPADRRELSRGFGETAVTAHAGSANYQLNQL
jgi:hypothetical protein